MTKVGQQPQFKTQHTNFFHIDQIAIIDSDFKELLNQSNLCLLIG